MHFDNNKFSSLLCLHNNSFHWTVSGLFTVDSNNECCQVSFGKFIRTQRKKRILTYFVTFDFNILPQNLITWINKINEIINIFNCNSITHCPAPIFRLWYCAINWQIFSPQFSKHQTKNKAQYSIDVHVFDANSNEK